jgi:membrane-associated phospholipid phosphatase
LRSQCCSGGDTGRSFRSYLIATALTFSLGSVSFTLLPTAPPWMSDPGYVSRVTHHVIGSVFGVAPAASEGDPVYDFKPNHMAAFPSVHVAVTVLVFLVASRISRVGQLIGGLYALMMTVSVVYLGEHFVLDALSGWLVALSIWWMARGTGIHR